MPSAHSKIWATRRTEPPEDFAAASRATLRRGRRRRLGPSSKSCSSSSSRNTPRRDRQETLGQRRRALSGRLLMRARHAPPASASVVDCAVAMAVRPCSPTATAGELDEAAGSGETVRLEVQADRRPFDRDGWAAGRARCLGSTASRPHRGRLLVGFRSAGRAARIGAARDGALPSRAAHPEPPTCCSASRFRLLAAQTLLHYPALWWASVRGRVPLHVSVTAGAGGVTMIAGPGRGREVDHAVGRAERAVR